jgi:hypothetical protein
MIAMGPKDFISYSKRRLWSVALAFWLSSAALVACGRADVGSGASTGTPSASASAARTSPPAGPTPTNDETAGWETFNSGAYGYTIKYPAGWVAPASPDNQQSFASENAGGPMGLSTSGIWFYVLITNASAADCPRTNVANSGGVVSESPVNVAGASGTKYVLNDSDGFFDVVVNVWHGRCYDYFFATKTPAARDSYAHVIDLILGHFAFGQ